MEHIMWKGLLLSQRSQPFGGNKLQTDIYLKQALYFLHPWVRSDPSDVIFIIKQLLQEST